MSALALTGRTAVVTGAAGPLGLAAARGLLEEGAQVALIDIDAMRLDGLIRFLRGTTIAVAGDVTQADAVRQAHLQAEKLLGPVDILVNAASLQAVRDLTLTVPGGPAGMAAGGTSRGLEVGLRHNF